VSRPTRRPHPAIVEAREAIALEQEHEDAKLRRVYRAIMVSPTLTVCRELLNGENVPLSRLDPVAVRRYGLRAVVCAHCGTPAERVTLDDFNRVAENGPRTLSEQPRSAA
jgi:hypothetical protein